MLKKKIVIALGGNALGSTPTEQLKLIKETAKYIVDLVSAGHKVIVTHGNGPQVGMINLAMEYSNLFNSTPAMPFAECGAMSQGYIGYQLQQAIQLELHKRSSKRSCVTLITQVLVSSNDRAFSNPTKPIGSFYTKDDALKIEKEKKYQFINDAGRGYRRVVPSPKPIKVLEFNVIKKLFKGRHIVIACGGGGVPVIETSTGLKGIDAVIDKDMTSAKLASQLKADVLLIVTAVDQVSLNFNTKDEIKLKTITTAEAKKYIQDNEFAPGSMLPKIEACIEFVTSNKKGIAIVTSLANAKNALEGKLGTVIKYGGIKNGK